MATYQNIIDKQKDKYHLEDGVYEGVIEDIELTNSKGGNEMFKITIKLAKQKCWDYIMLNHPNENVLSIAFKKVTKMFENIGIKKDDFFDNVEQYLTDFETTFTNRKVSVKIKDDRANIISVG